MSKSSLTEEDLQQLKADALKILGIRRKSLLFSYPFIGSIAMRLDLVPVRDFRVRTACTDGDCVYVDISFLKSLDADEQKFVLAHEVWHTVLMHLTRKQSRDAALFNIATDKEVNGLLADDGFKAPKFVLMPDSSEKGKSAEEIYEMLLKKMKSSSSGSGAKSSSRSSGGSKSSGSQFDKHVYDNDPVDDGEDGDAEHGITDEWGEVGIDKDFHPKVSKDFADKMREAIVAEAQRCEKSRGTLPSGVKDLVKKMLEPELKWEEVLAQFVTRCSGGMRKEWLPPNRRHVYNDVYIQSRRSEKIKIAVGIDTSGSTYADRGKFLGELLGLVRSFGAFSIDVIECDAEVENAAHFTEDDGLESILSSHEYEMTGGGGTCLMPIFDYVKEHQLDVDCVCVMTDGYIDDIKSNPLGVPVIWLVTKDGTEDFCDWGVKVKFKSNS